MWHDEKWARRMWSPGLVCARRATTGRLTTDMHEGERS